MTNNDNYFHDGIKDENNNYYGSTSYKYSNNKSVDEYNEDDYSHDSKAVIAYDDAATTNPRFPTEKMKKNNEGFMVLKRFAELQDI